MRILHRGRRGDRIVDIDVDDGRRAVAELVAALDPDLDPAIGPVIDGAPVTADSPLSAVILCEGSLVDTTGEPITSPRPGPSPSLAAFGPGLRSTQVGRSPSAVAPTPI